MPGKAKWTFMVYMAGDNNLEDDGLRDLHEMKVVGSSDELAVVAQFDRMSGQKTRRYYLTAGGDLDSDCVLEMPGINTGDPLHLISFINWTCHNYEAENYALILWNHGSGWKDFEINDRAKKAGGEKKLSSRPVRSIKKSRAIRAMFSSSLDKMVSAAVRRGILIDKSAADFLDNQELAKVFIEASAALDGKLRILGFDACLMNMLEIHYQVRDCCEIVVGSQEIEPEDGWPYDALLAPLAGDPRMTAEEFSKIIVHEYIASYQNREKKQPVTQSAVRLAAANSLYQAVSSLGSALEKVAKTRPGQEMVVDALRKGQRFEDLDYVDLRRFAEMLAAEDEQGEVGQAAQDVLKLLAGAKSPVLANSTDGDAVKHASGISIYLPSRIYSPLYDDLDFADHYHWDEFLKAFHYRTYRKRS